MEEYLEITEENVEQLKEMGLTVAVGEELTCEVDYAVYGADPDAGISEAYPQVFSVTYNDVDVTVFCDLEAIEASIMAERHNRKQNGG